jgi:hypothetical protein
LVRKSQYSLAGTFHRRRSRLLKTGSFRAGKGAENTKEKFRQCFTVREASIYLSLDLPFQDFWSLEACYSWKDLKLDPSPIRKEPSNSFGTVFFLSLLMHNLARKVGSLHDDLRKNPLTSQQDLTNFVSIKKQQRMFSLGGEGSTL